MLASQSAHPMPMSAKGLLLNLCILWNSDQSQDWKKAWRSQWHLVKGITEYVVVTHVGMSFFIVL